MRAADALHTVIPAFNVPYLPMMEPITRTLVECGAFGLIEVARLEFCKFEAQSPTAVAEAFRRHADRRFAALHLDHTPVIDEDLLDVDWRALIAEAVACGYDSVMVDGSRLAFDENVAVTAEVVGMAHPHGICVEAELGAVLGHESGPMPPYEELFASKRGFTDPGEAGEFVRRTGVDWLSVSAGSVHGAIGLATKDQAKVQARLDVEHVRALRKAAGVPLVLHGGSGIRQEYIHGAIGAGIAKVNVGTDLRQPYERTLAEGGSASEAASAVAAATRRQICEVFGIEGSALDLRREAVRFAGA